MKLKIFTSTQALDHDKHLEDMVNEFCINHEIVNINCTADEGEIYVFITYLGSDTTEEDYLSGKCDVCGYDEDDPYRDVIAHEQHLQKDNDRRQLLCIHTI